MGESERFSCYVQVCHNNDENLFEYEDEQDIEDYRQEWLNSKKWLWLTGWI